ncbi:MAG: DNA-binding response regulator [Caulobacterales bacterium 68-7]|nr:response regulator transcription factor [Caulobacterales bacterium]OJU09083.1 MAG: DNA-binding response regulator [Caulobacterales bacterium 68-7]
MRALVVEDDPVVGPDVVRALNDAGFAAELSRDGLDAWRRAGDENFAVVVLDLGLPRLDGLSVLRRWRSEARGFPVLILSARGDWTEKVEGIEAGADDYLAKPFQVGELTTRVRALVRRSAGLASPVLQVGDLVIDGRRMTVTQGGAPVRLSPLEFRLIDYLGHNADRAVSAGELAEQLYGGDAADTNSIEALIVRLRRKIGPRAIETHRGFGYRLSAAP